MSLANQTKYLCNLNSCEEYVGSVDIFIDYSIFFAIFLLLKSTFLGC